MRMRCTCFGTQPKLEEKTLKPSPQNSLKLLPHWHRLPKWAKILEGQYKLWSSINCVFLNKRVECNTHIQRLILGGTQTILRPKDCKRMICHKDITKRETSNQAIKRYQLKQAIKGYQLNQLDQWSYVPHEWNKLWYEQRSVLEKLEKLPMICAQFSFVIGYNEHKIGSSLPQDQ